MRFTKRTYNAAQRHIDGVRYSNSDLAKYAHLGTVTDPKLRKILQRVSRARVECELRFHKIELGTTPAGFPTRKPVTWLWNATRAFYDATSAAHDILFPHTDRF